MVRPSEAVSIGIDSSASSNEQISLMPPEQTAKQSEVSAQPLAPVVELLSPPLAATAKRKAPRRRKQRPCRPRRQGASVFLNGMEVDRFMALARRAADLASKLTGVRIRFQPIPKAAHMGRRRLATVVKAWKARGCGSILASFEGPYINHWSIIRGVTATTLSLFDSNDRRHFKLRNCRLLTTPKPRAKPRYWVKLHGVFITEDLTVEALAGKRRMSKTAMDSRKARRTSP